ncbi:hypothetical protein PRVXT_002442 [Proteinivorax tanatarense]|uniref:Peptidase M50 domain-containing protein n=1 Tax=Proteinivorax tanatarense TaxID=1260629 RepID=A0AAU7VKA9_9FIRM
MFFYILILYFLLIASHELGHFLTGWYLGIPPNRMSVQLFKYPPQVLLKDNSGGKVSVDNFEKYFKIMEKYISTEKAFWFYIIGGNIFEFMTVLVLSIFALSIEAFPLFPVRISIFLMFLTSLAYLAIDVVFTLYVKRPYGDFSGAWMIKPFLTSVFYVVYFGSYILIYLLLK